MSEKKTAIVTGASHGIGAGLVEAFLKAGYNVVGTALDATQSLTSSPGLVLVDGDIGRHETAVKAVDAAMQHFGTIDVLVNNAGIFRVSAISGMLLASFHELLGIGPLPSLDPQSAIRRKSANAVRNSNFSDPNFWPE